MQDLQRAGVAGVWVTEIRHSQHVRDDANRGHFR